MKKYFSIILLSIVVFLGCQDSSKKEIPFTVAENYFVKNTVDELKTPKFTDEEAFEQVFGTATTMGESGKPTPINFSKEFVVAVALPETKKETAIRPVKLVEEDDKLVFSYHKEEGEEMSHSIKPALLIIVDKKYEKEVVVVEK